MPHTNPTEKKEYARLWYRDRAKDPAFLLARAKRKREAYAKEREHWRSVGRAWQKKNRRQNPIGELLRDARSRAKRKGMKFNITRADLSLPSFCPVLGIPLFIGDGSHTNNSPTIDRVNNARGYVRGNVRIISYRANTLKRDASLGELEKVVADLRKLLA